jgi:TatD DNase family protein
MTDRAKPDDPRLAGLRRAPLAEQLEVFHAQLAITAERNLPATIHCLDAFGSLLDALQKGPTPARGFLLHAYSGPAEMINGFAKLGAYFSFNGAFLEPRKQRVREVFAAVPSDRLLVETDAPAMSLPADRARFHLPPSPEGALVNHPANLAIAYEGLAEIRRVDPAVLADSVAANFQRLFGF